MAAASRAPATATARQPIIVPGACAAAGIRRKIAGVPDKGGQRTLVATPLQILIVEDNPDDVTLVVRELVRGGFAPVYHRVETAPAMKSALGAQPWDLIIADYAMPTFSGVAAL